MADMAFVGGWAVVADLVGLPSSTHFLKAGDA
ncbi:hypothetical protein Syncc8109_2370 [Synechococcus sp. WH 8109]|nr:hypothetical protein Syncc8109_2370 [Synechococcus sp. WH 8109]